MSAAPAGLAALLLELRPLVADTATHWERIVQLLASHRDLAEYEVARFFVSRPMLPAIARLSQSPDPLERRQAAQAIGLVCTRSDAARLLRPLVKDADLGARARARRSLRQLGLTDVALPDGRIKPPRRPHARALGGWNPTGWSFGTCNVFAHQRRRKPAAPPREQLQAQKGLPKLAAVADLLKLLGLKSKAELTRLLRPGAGVGAPYVEFEIEKASGGARRIAAPRPKLRRVQRVILKEVLARLPVHEACHGFVPGRSVVSNARPHEGAAIVVKMDLRDFFPTIHFRRVQGLFEHYGYGDEVARALAGLCTHRPVLPDGRVLWPGVVPQGAPTSPALSNLLCRRLDARLSGLAAKVGAVYTRYADDLTFSFRAEPEGGVGRFLWWVDQVCQQEGFTERTEKRRVLRRKSQQRVTGVVVNAGLSVPRAARRRFRAILENCRRNGVAAEARGRKDFAAYLLGFAAYVKMVQPALGQRLLAEVRALLRG